MESELLKQRYQPAPTPITPIFPINADFDLLTSFRGGVPVSVEIVADGKMLMHPSDAMELMKRGGYIIIHHKDSQQLPGRSDSNAMHCSAEGGTALDKPAVLIILPGFGRGYSSTRCSI